MTASHGVIVPLRQDHYQTGRRVVALDGHDWGVYTDSRDPHLGGALDATVGSGVMQEAAAGN
jgi:hypothetical protein